MTILWFDRHRRLRDRLSAYIDGRLNRPQTRALERHIEECAACREQLAGLRAAVGALHDLPQADVPRSFALTPEQAAGPRPSRPAPAPSATATGIGLAGAALAAALVAALVIDLGGFRGDGGPSERDGLPVIQGAPAEMEAPLAVDANAAEEDAAKAARQPAPSPSLGEGAATTGGPTTALPTATPTPAAEAPPAASPTPFPAPPDTTAIPRVPAPSAAYTAVPAAEATFVPVGPVPEAGPREGLPATAEDGGGIDALRAAEIGLAVALGLTVLGTVALSFAGRRR